MKRKLIWIYALLMTVTVIILSVILSENAKDNRISDESMQMEKASSNMPIPTPAYIPAKVSMQTEKVESNIPIPTPVYIPTKEDLEFMEMVKAEGKTITLEISEWDMLEIMCSKMGFDKYHFRFIEYEEKFEKGVYRLANTRNAAIAAQYYYYGLDSKTGNIIEDIIENPEYRSIGNIFTMKTKPEPFRLPEDEKLIEIFIERILGDLPKGIEVTFGQTQGGDLYFSTYQIIDTEKVFLREYWVNESTWEIFDLTSNEVYGTLFD